MTATAMAQTSGVYQTMAQNAQGEWATSPVREETEERAIAVTQRNCLDRLHPGVVPNKAAKYVNTSTGKEVVLDCVEYRAKTKKR